MGTGKHGFSGSCAPSVHTISSMKTFSYGVFEWLPKKGGKAMKKGPVKVRVSGSISNAESIMAKAAEIAKLLDAGEYNGPKRVHVNS